MANFDETTIQKITDLNPELGDKVMDILGYTKNTGNRTQKLIDTYKKQGNLSTGQIGDIFATTPIESPTSAPKVQNTPTMPEPQATKIQDAYMTSLTENQANTRKALEDTYKSQKEALDREKEALDIKQQEYMANIDPTTRPTWEQETRVMQNQLNASEAASKTLQTNFEEKQKLVNELDTLLSEGNAVIQQERQAPGAVPSVITNARVNRAIQDVSARAGVIQAVLSARDGQIAQAHNIINQARGAVEAQWNDQKEYYTKLLEYNDEKIISLDEQSQEIAKKQLGLVENDLKQIEETTNYLKEQMIDPKNAQFMADAGVKLTDSIQVINQKMAQQARVIEIREQSNKLAEKGYTQVPAGTAGALPFKVGGTTLYFQKTGKGIDGKDGEDTRNEYIQAQEFVTSNPEATDQELKSALLRDSNLSVTDINAIVADRKNKIDITENEAKNLSISLIEEYFEPKWWKTRGSELEDAKTQARDDITNDDTLTEGERERMLKALDSITIDDIEI